MIQTAELPANLYPFFLIRLRSIVATIRPTIAIHVSLDPFRIASTEEYWDLCWTGIQLGEI